MCLLTFYHERGSVDYFVAVAAGIAGEEGFDELESGAVSGAGDEPEFVVAGA